MLRFEASKHGRETMQVIVKFMTLTGKFATAREERFASLAEATVRSSERLHECQARGEPRRLRLDALHCAHAGWTRGT